MPYVLEVSRQTNGKPPVGARYEREPYTPKGGEVVFADATYESQANQGYVWDAATQTLRPVTAAELLLAAQTKKEREIKDALNRWYLEDVRSVEGDITVYKRSVNAVLSAEETSIFNTVNSNYTKRNTAIASVRAATTVAQVDAVAIPTWDRTSG